MIDTNIHTKKELLLLAGHHAECLCRLLTALGHKNYLIDHQSYDGAYGCAQDARYFIKKLEGSES